MPRNSDEPNGWIIFAWGCAIAVGALGTGLALKWVIPVLFYSIGAAINIVMAGTSTGLFAPWVIQVGFSVAICTGLTTSITLIVKGLDKAKRNPYDWMATIMAVLQPLSLDFVKEFSPGDPLARLSEKAVALALFLVGVLLWRQTSRLVVAIGVVLILLPPVWVTASLLALNWNQGLWAAAIATSPLTWFALALMLFASLATLVLKYKLE
jgi:ABC-type multidrug transport system fused ATPase/permease subunit